MSRSTYAPRETYIGAGNNAVYTFDFKIEALAQLTILEFDSAGVETERVDGTDVVYLSGVVFDGVAGAGTVTLAANLATGRKLVLLLASDAPTQDSEWKGKGSFTLDKIEAALDVLSGAIQRSRHLGLRSVVVSDFIDDGDFDPILPIEITDAVSRTIVTKADGTGFEIGPDTSTIFAAIAAAAAAAVSETNAAVSAAAALVSENNASTSETAAALSETIALASAAAALVSELAAAVSAAAALVSENNASTSETNAATSETNAATSETNAATSAAAALVSEAAALVSELAAAVSEVAAAASAAAALVSEINAAASAAAAAAGAGTWLTKDNVFGDFLEAALTKTVTLHVLPALTFLEGIHIKHNTAFAGAAIATLLISVGIASNPTKFIEDFDLLAATSDTNFDDASFHHIGSHVGNTNIILTITATGANLDALSAGVLVTYMKLRGVI